MQTCISKLMLSHPMAPRRPKAWNKCYGRCGDECSSPNRSSNPCCYNPCMVLSVIKKTAHFSEKLRIPTDEDDRSSARRRLMPRRGGGRCGLRPWRRGLAVVLLRRGAVTTLCPCSRQRFSSSTSRSDFFSGAPPNLTSVWMHPGGAPYLTMVKSTIAPSSMS